MTKLEDVDFATIKPCPNCDKPVRMFAGGKWWLTETESFNGWWCRDCLRDKAKKAVDQLKGESL